MIHVQKSINNNVCDNTSYQIATNKNLTKFQACCAATESVVAFRPIDRKCPGGSMIWKNASWWHRLPELTDDLRFRQFSYLFCNHWNQSLVFA